MSITAVFQTNDTTLERLWNQSIDCFESFDNDEDAFYSVPAALPVYVCVSLMLTADTEAVAGLLTKVHTTLTARMKKPDRVTALICYRYVSAVFAYVTYVGQGARQDFIEKAASLITAADSYSTSLDGVYAAHRIGAYLLLRRLFDESKERIPFTVNLPKEIAEFHRAYYDSKQGVYCEDGIPSLLLNCLPSYYGFSREDGQENICEYLITHSLEVTPKDACYLYGAISHLELYDSLLPTVLEGIVSIKAENSPAMLAPLETILTELCGVDAAMLGQGIRCSRPCMPDTISYRLLLPSCNGMILYDGGEKIDPFFY